MEKMTKTERLIAITKILTESPKEQFSLNEFAEMFGCAKSTLSEDLSAIQSAFKKSGAGILESVIGAGGGVKYIPKLTKGYIQEFSQNLCNIIKDEKRIIPGGFLYLNDIIFSPQICNKAGRVFASIMSNVKADYVVTVETKGISLALNTAFFLNLPLVVVRRGTRVTEGPALSITYISGTSGRIQTMSLPKRAIEKGASIIFIDDFMRAGGTAKGIMELMNEFGAKLVCTGIFISTKEPKHKLIDDHISLLTLNRVDSDNKEIDIVPSSIDLL